MPKKIVLAYSGGLDTSIILKWLQENYSAEVIAYTADIGQEIDKKKIIKNAKKLGVKKIIINDLILQTIPIKKYSHEWDSELLYNEPKYIRFDDGGLHTLKSNGLTMKQGVYY